MYDGEKTSQTDAARYSGTGGIIRSPGSTHRTGQTIQTDAEATDAAGHAVAATTCDLANPYVLRSSDAAPTLSPNENLPPI